MKDRPPDLLHLHFGQPTVSVPRPSKMNQICHIRTISTFRNWSTLHIHRSSEYMVQCDQELHMTARVTASCEQPGGSILARWLTSCQRLRYMRSLKALSGSLLHNDSTRIFSTLSNYKQTSGSVITSYIRIKSTLEHFGLRDFQCRPGTNARMC